jgi:N-acetylglucosaminyldiphosphoundecaprenol N-acetyl-beta-D-mannosaminyltransferase
MKKTDDKALLFDLNVFSSRRGKLLNIFEGWLNEPRELHVVYTPNPEQIIQSRGNDKFKQALQQADLLLPDGIGLVWASKLLALFGRAKPLSERIAGVDAVTDLLELAHQRQLEVLVVGGRDYSPEDYFTYQGSKINWTPGFKEASGPTVEEQRQLELKIKEIQPDLVFVALGAPAQELWIEEHRALLSKNRVVVAMAVGGSFDYLLNKVSRAPYWFRKLGLEWLFRLINEPWRLKRQLRIIGFLGLVIKKLFS